MATFELKLRPVDRSILMHARRLNRLLPDSFPASLLIQLRVYHIVQDQNNPEVRICDAIKPDQILQEQDSFIFSRQGMIDFLSKILAVEGIQVESNGQFLSRDGTENLQHIASDFAERLRSYAMSQRTEVHYGAQSHSPFVPVAIGLGIVRYQQLQLLDGVMIRDRIESLPVSKSKRTSPAVRLEKVKVNQGLSSEDCSICLERFVVGQLGSRTPCKHTFHSKCIAPWVLERQSCPLCRADLSVNAQDF